MPPMTPEAIRAAATGTPMRFSIGNYDYSIVPDALESDRWWIVGPEFATAIRYRWAVTKFYGAVTPTDAMNMRCQHAIEVAYALIWGHPISEGYTNSIRQWIDSSSD